MARPRKNAKEPVTREDLQNHRKSLYHPVRLSDGGWQVKNLKIGAVNRYTALLFAFQQAESPAETEYLFWEIADHLWNKDPNDQKFAKHRWSYQIVHNACRERYLAIGGAGSSGKSYTCAGWGIINWLADPANTLVLMTSTDLGGAKKRIWGAAMKLLQMVPDPPCKIVDSLGIVKYYDGATAFNTSGIQLVTADKNHTRVGKLIGIKAKKIILVADELGEMGPNVQSAATGNLSKNPSFAMIGLSNPASRFDPFGIFAEPRLGWESVNTETDYEWRTKLNGLYLRLDSEQSPNFDASDNPEYETNSFFPYLPTQSQIDEAIAILGATPEEARKSREYMRFNRAIFFDSDGQETVYSESEFIRAGALGVAKLQGSTLIAGFDPSFSNNGDKSVLTFAEVGFDENRQFCICYKETCYIYDDATNTVDPRNLQIAEKVKRECVKRNVEVTNLAIDASGAGGGFCDMLAIVWKPGFLRVQFGGAASDKKIKNDSKVTAKERYRNRASELFFIGKQFLIGRQIYGIPPIVAKQMSNRGYETTKGQHGLMLQVEPKQKYKARVGSSPDETDSFLVAVELARTQHLFTPADPVQSDRKKNDLAAWLGTRRTHGTYAADKLGFVANL